jgi:hypothetical protein
MPPPAPPAASDVTTPVDTTPAKATPAKSLDSSDIGGNRPTTPKTPPPPGMPITTGGN